MCVYEEHSFSMQETLKEKCNKRKEKLEELGAIILPQLQICGVIRQTYHFGCVWEDRRSRMEVSQENQGSTPYLWKGRYCVSTPMGRQLPA